MGYIVKEGKDLAVGDFVVGCYLNINDTLHSNDYGSIVKIVPVQAEIYKVFVFNEITTNMMHFTIDEHDPVVVKVPYDPIIINPNNTDFTITWKNRGEDSLSFGCCGGEQCVS